MAEAYIAPMWSRFGKQVTNPDGSKKMIWSDFNTPNRPPDATHYQENYAPLDPASNYVRKRQFRDEPGVVFTSPPAIGNSIAGAHDGVEFTQQCALADLPYLSAFYLV